MLKVGIDTTPRITRAGRTTGRRVPNDIASGVEEWARKHGRHAKLFFYEKPINCWGVKLSYKVGDPRQQDGSKDEVVFLHEWKDAHWWALNDKDRAKKAGGKVQPSYKAFELDEIGLTGIIEKLDKGDLLSGRGEFESAEQAGRRQVEKFRDAKHKRRRDARGDADHRARDIRRTILKIPFIPVGIQLGKSE